MVTITEIERINNDFGNKILKCVTYDLINEMKLLISKKGNIQVI